MCVCVCAVLLGQAWLCSLLPCACHKRAVLLPLLAARVASQAHLVAHSVGYCTQPLSMTSLVLVAFCAFASAVVSQYLGDFDQTLPAVNVKFDFPASAAVGVKHFGGEPVMFDTLCVCALTAVVSVRL